MLKTRIDTNTTKLQLLDSLLQVNIADIRFKFMMIRTIILFVLVSILVNAEDEFGIWIKGPNVDECLIRNVTLTDKLDRQTLTEDVCCPSCKDVCILYNNSTRIFCGFDVTQTTMCTA